jgi:hypothetical protein
MISEDDFCRLVTNAILDPPFESTHCWPEALS